jgi:hypothetical protein
MKLLSRIFIIGLINFFIISFGHAEILDNTDAGFSTVGSWGTSSYTPGYYGSNYRYASSGSGSKQATWSFSVSAGQYEISVQWAAFQNRASNAVYLVFNNGVEIGTQIFDQQVNGGQFNVFDTIYVVDAGTLDVVLTDDANGYVIADAVQVVFLGPGDNIPPNGVIDTPSSDVTITVGGTVDFTGTGTDPDNDLPLSYLWNFGAGSGISDSTEEDPGLVQFDNEGSFTVTFTVTDSLMLSDPTPATVVVTVENPSSDPVIVDNMDAGFSTVGSWGASSYTPGYYGSNYRFHSPGSGTNRAEWTFNVIEGEYEISAQWAALENRASNAEYRVFNNSVEIGSQVLDQRFNGGVFNVFTSSYMVQGGTLKVELTDNANGYVIADAVKVVFLGSGGNTPPIIDPISDDSVDEGTAYTGPTPTLSQGSLPVTWSLQTGPAGMTINAATGVVSWPSPTVIGSPHTITIEATNAAGSDQASWNLTVNFLVVSDPVIVDNTDAGFSTVGSWGTSSYTPGYYGSNYRYIDVSPGANSAKWSLNLPEGKYEIFAQWAEFDNRASNAKYTIFNNGIELRNFWADQRINGGQFNFLGVFYLESGTQDVVLSELVTMNGVIIADAVKFENICQADPCIYVKSPQDYHLQTSATIQVSAVVQTQGSTSYGVLFILDEGTAVEQQNLDLTQPFNANFIVSLPSEMEHSIDVYLTNSSGIPLGGVNGHDFVLSVGVGNYDVAMGDSTTDGVGDDDIVDDISGDLRNGGGGYPPVLNDLLTAYYNGVPHTVVNEGVSGALSADGVAIVNSLLAKHPDAQRFLLQYGINDAGVFPPEPSGLGLDPGNPDYPGTYKHNLQQMIDAINGDIREVCLAKVPIVLGD